MYCVRCGVKLQEGEKSCPLCRTPVWLPNSDGKEKKETYSDRYPEEKRHGLFFLLGVMTVMMVTVALTSLIICLRTYGQVRWSGYVMLGMALLWIVLVLPSWFKKWRPFVFVPVDFAAVGGYLLYIYLYNRQHWFLSFAFPVVGMACIMFMAAMALFKYVRKGRLYITGGMLMLFGAGLMLVEFFEHITFGTTMFLWSLYGVCFFGTIGLFLIIAATIPNLRGYLERKFFF